jgi:PKD repeat protein
MVGGSVFFTDTSSNNPTSWSWSFQGGTPSSSTAQNPTVTYNSVGTYTVELTATNSSGSDTETKVAYVAVAAPQPPVANFTASSTSIYAGQSVSFTDTTTNNPTSWSWTFNGGTPSSSTAQNPSVTYNTAGTYTVSLTAYNGAGNDTETKTNYITVQEAPLDYCTSSSTNHSYEWIAGVSVEDLNNTSGAAGYTDFTGQTANLTADAGAGVSLTPGFGSGTYSEYWTIWIDYNIDGDFADSGEQVFQGSGSGTVTGSFNVPAGVSGLTRMRVVMQYNSYRTDPCGSFTYGEVEDYSVNITGAVINPPVADFSAGSTSIVMGQSVSFTDTSSNNPTSWSWTFSGGTPSSSTSQNPTITYNTAGTYTVSLTATNSAGSDTETKSAYITVSAPPAPVANFTAGSTSISVGQSVSFTDTSGNTPTSWSWSFEGGTPSSSTSQNPTVQYNTEGTYNVSLTATNSGGSDTETKTDYITVTSASADDIADAVDNGALTFDHSGNADWNKVTDVYYYDGDSAESGNIGDSQSSTIETSVTVSSTKAVKFYWKVSSEANYDYLRFYIDGVEKTAIAGTVDWTQVSYNIGAGTHTLKWSFTKDVSVSSGSDCGWVDKLELADPVADPIAEAVDDASLTFSLSGNGNWFSQSTTTYYGGDAAQSADIGNSQTTTMETTISGKTSVKFYWRVSSESNYDYLRFYIDGVQQDSISGTVNWTQKTYSVSTGTHTLKWSFTKDGSVSSGSDCGWVDKVELQ